MSPRLESSAASSVGVCIGLPSTALITSPTWRPAIAPGPFGDKSVISAPAFLPSVTMAPSAAWTKSGANLENYSSRLRRKVLISNCSLKKSTTWVRMRVASRRSAYTAFLLLGYRPFATVVSCRYGGANPLSSSSAILSVRSLLRRDRILRFRHEGRVVVTSTAILPHLASPNHP